MRFVEAACLSRLGMPTITFDVDPPALRLSFAEIVDVLFIYDEGAVTLVGESGGSSFDTPDELCAHLDAKADFVFDAALEADERSPGDPGCLYCERGAAHEVGFDLWICDTPACRELWNAEPEDRA
jgi:hypothetical protein